MTRRSEVVPEQVYTPTLFIGSSKEALDWAKAAQAELSDAAVVSRWDQGNFPSGWNTLRSLLQIADSYDFTLMIASGDDVVVSRGRQSYAPRDNVLLEYGLFL